MEQALYYSLFVNKGPWLPIDHSKNNLVGTDQIFNIFTSPSSLSHTGFTAWAGFSSHLGNWYSYGRHCVILLKMWEWTVTAKEKCRSVHITFY